MPKFVNPAVDKSYMASIASMAGLVRKDADYSALDVLDIESNISLDYSNAQEYFVGDKWFPLKEVKTVAGLLPRWSIENRFTNRAAAYRAGTIPEQAELKVRDPITYVTERYAVELPLPDDIPWVADEAYDIEVSSTQMVTDILQLNKEILIADAYFKAGIWGIDLTGVASGETWAPGDVSTGETFRKFNDQDSDIISLFRDMRMAMKKKVGVLPNTIVCSEPVYESLRIHDQIISLFRNPQGQPISETRVNADMVARALDIDPSKFLVAGAMKNTSAVGTSTPVLDWIFGDGLWLGYVDTIGLHKTVAGVNLSFNTPLGGFDTAMVQVPDQRTHTTFFQGFQNFACKVYEPGAGIFLTDCI